MKISSYLVALLLFLCSCYVFAETKDYIRDYNYKATDYDSKYTSRIYALDGVKIKLLNELGTYVKSVVSINKDSLGGSYISQDTVNLTAGIINLKVMDENWNRVSYYIKALMKADQDEVLNALKKLQNKHELKKSLKDSVEELEEARLEIKKLRVALNQGNLNRKDNLKNIKTYNNAISAMEAELLFQGALQSQRDGDFNKSITLLKKVAEQGYARAQSRLGHMYERGRGVKKDYTKAVYWYKKALAQGYAKAISRMGFIYERGLVEEINLYKAAELYRQAADKGEKLSTARLGYLYQTGGLRAGY